MSDKLESKDLIEALGYSPDDFKSVDEFREKVGAEWIRRSNAEKDEGIQRAIIGTYSNRVEKAVINGAKDFGITLTDDDFKDAKYTDERVKIAVNKMKETFANETGNLKKLAESKGKEFAGEIQGKYETLEKNYNSVLELNKQLEGQVTEKEKWANEQIKSFKINDFKAKAEEKVRSVWKDNPSEFEIIGFKTKMNEKYEVDVDEKEGLIVFERATKKRIANPSVVNSFMTYDQVIEMELKTAGLDKKNPHQVQKPVNPFAGNGNGQNNNNGSGGRKFPVNPAFYKKD